MTFELPVTPVGHRPRRTPIVAAGASLLLVVGAALLTSGTSGTPDRSVAVASGTPAARSPSGEFRVVAAGGAVGVEPALPDEIECPDLDRLSCLRIARAALRLLPADAPSVREITVWKSLLCSDELECPHRYLDGSIPLGSALIRYVDGERRVAVNVVDWRHGDGIRLGPRAWLARSVFDDKTN